MKTQRNKVLSLLQNAGQSGVSSYEFTFNHQIKQAPTRIHELKEQGYNIISKPHGKTVIYILDSQLPVYLKPQASKPIVEPQKQAMTWIFYKNTDGYDVAKQVPVSEAEGLSV